MSVLHASLSQTFASFYTRYGVPILSKWLTHILVGFTLLWLDLTSGKFLSFPVLFVLPVAFAGWYSSARVSYSLAVLLPLGRMAIGFSENANRLSAFIVTNAVVRMGVLLFIAYLVIRNSRQTRELQARVESLVTICAWSRTVKYEDEWISFEQYLLRRFNINTSHGISPSEAEKIFKQLENHDRAE